MQSNKFMAGALLLTLAGLISKILSAGYRIPLQNLTGDTGFYIYQQVYPILGIATILALYGFPTAVSKLTAEREAISFKHFVFPIFIILLVICGTISLLLFLNAETLAEIAGNKELTSAYKVSSAIFLVVPFTALFRGVFQGKSFMKPTAYSQLGEQLLRVSVIIFAAVMVAYYGWDLYRIGTFASIASIIGAVFALFILLLFYLKKSPVLPINQPTPWKESGRTILVFGFIASLNHMILLIIQLVDSFTMVPGLLHFGLTLNQAMEAKGVFDRGQPLIQIGAVLGSSLGLALIPAITRKRKGIHEKEEFQNQISGAIKISFFLAFGATLGLILLFPEVNRLLYQDTQGSKSLTILMLAVVLSAIVITTCSILQGMGKEKWTAILIISTLAMKWVLNIILVPRFGITGSALATILSLLFLLIGTFICIGQNVHRTKLIQIKWKAFIIAASSMGLFVGLVDILINTNGFSRLNLLLYIFLVAIIGAALYIFLLLRLQVFSDRELSLLPFGSRLTHRSVTKWSNKSK